MNFDEFLSKVEKIREKKPKFFNEQDPPSTESEIAEVEGKLGVDLPEEYRLFLKKYGGGYFFFTNIFSTTLHSEWNIIEQNKAIRYKPDNFIAISDNEVGDYYGFKINDDKSCNTEIVFLDHETQSVKPTKYSNLFEFIFIIGIEAGVEGRFD